MIEKYKIKQTIKIKKSSACSALILMLIVSAIMTVVPVINAHTPPQTIGTYAYVSAAPNPLGVGQPTTIVMWLDKCPPTATGSSGQFWEGYKLTITKPDGTQQIIGPVTCNSAVASTWVPFTPDKVGIYTLVFSWPGQTVTNGTGQPRISGIPFVGDYFEGATSEALTLVVQQNPIQQWQEPPLPTEYWTRPINDANRGWSTLASNWLQGGWLVNKYQKWGTAPESPHVLWTQPITPGLAGGISDAAWPGIPSDVNDYEAPYSAPIVMNGKIYYNTPAVSDVATYGYYCRDLYTGEITWYKNGTDNGLNNPFTTGSGYNLGQTYPALTQGWLYHYDSINGNGILSYLIMTLGTTWYILDASTGNLRLTLKNVPTSGYAVTDQDGSLLYYSYNSKTGNMLCWNISQSIPPLGPVGTEQGQWKARFGATIDAVNDTSWTNIGTGAASSGAVNPDDIRPRSGYTMNTTIQSGLPGSIYILQDDNRVPKMIFGEYVTNLGQGALGAEEYAGYIGNYVGAGDTFSAWCATINEHAVPYSPYPNATSTQNTNLGFGVNLNWNKNFTVPIPGKGYTWVVGGVAGWLGVDYNSQIFTLSCVQTRQMWGYSLATGNLLWGPTTPLPAMDYYNWGSAIYDGIILTPSIRWQMSGSMYAFNATTGKLLWTYNATNIGSESPYGANYPVTIGAVCDGKIYLYSDEHSPTKPLWRGSYVRCVNLTNGKEMWKLLGFNDGRSSGVAIADGYLISGSEYDNLLYCIGKGPSATTVTAPDTVIPKGTEVLIQGTVTDESPGAKLISEQQGSKVAAISDADQQTWMEYLYEQQAKPNNAVGVPVHITAIDPNGNWQDIGIAISDDHGTYAISWTPPVPGLYKVTATFDGTNSYYKSDGKTSFLVSSAPSASIMNTPQPSATQPAVTTPTTPTQTATPAPSIAPPPTSAEPTTTYIAIGAVVIIVVIAAAALVIKRRK